MSNEEICIQIQSGKRELLEDLWKQVERYVRQQAKRIPEQPSADWEDFVQAGFIAVAKAAESYDPASEASFLTYLSYHLKTAFSEATGRRSDKQNRDPIHNAVSLDIPISDDGETTRLDLLPDDNDAFEEVEERIFQEQLRPILNDFLENIPDADILRQKYCDQMTLEQISSVQDEQIEDIRRREQAALRACRKTINMKAGIELKQFLEEMTDYYRHIGIDAFTRTHESTVESIVFSRMRLEREFYKTSRSSTSKEHERKDPSL